MSDVKLENITKDYPAGPIALRNLTLSIHEGELLVLMGPSGCGKTTTLRLIAGLERLTSGKIWIGGRIVDDVPPNQRNVAMVFQRPALYPHLTVEENLALGLRFSTGRKDKAHWKPIVANVSRVLHLEDLLDRLPMELSGGQQQRVALGRAIARAPGVLLLDEPLSNLDASLRTEMRRELHLLHQRLGVTMVYVTHDPAEALNLGERVALLQEGVLQQVGTPATIYERPANCLVAGSVGTPGMNLLDGELCGNQCEMRFCEGRAALRIPVEIARRWVAFSGRRLTLGIRPENVIMVTDSGGENARSVLMKGTLALAEWFGDHTLVTLHCETWRIAARMPGRVGFPVSSAKGELIEVRMDLTKVHLFDGVTGLALSHPGTG